ncbi:MAG: hypothetical protein NVS2B14_00690 [Chamaesiphon sp.]
MRLHGIKDYLDLVLLLERYPKLHQTVNLVPSLILQLEDYIAGTALDPYLTVALTPTEQLKPEQHQFIIEHFFDANHHTLIDPHPRYAQLYHQRQDKGQAWCLENWSLQDYSDLLAWHNLAWFDPLFWDDPDIDRWLKQGKDFTLGDRQRIYSKQREIMSRIIPQHRQMQEAGQLEVTTTPYTHPILPLLADTNVGRVAVPHMTLPQHRFRWVEDIPRHLQKAWDIYKDRFGREPQGLWPSEQAVSPEILPYIAQQGFRWICSDEAILGSTLKHFFQRDGAGNVLEPELIYRPYRLQTQDGDLAIVFRDHRLSDLIGFSYANHPEATEENNPEAWEALYAAEGSDWFWWFGEGHSSNQDAMFDQLFREHISAIYQALNEPIPPNVKRYVEVHEARSDRRPEGFIHPIIDGLGDEQDWDRAGRIDIGGARGTMHRSSAIQRVWYGVDHLNFYLRLDFQSNIRPGIDCPSELNLLWFYADRTMHNSPVPLMELPDEAPLNYLFHHQLGINLLTQSIQFEEAGEHHQWHPRVSRAQVALGKCLEVAVPWADLHIEPDYPLRMILVLADNGRFSSYLPENALIPIDVP